MTSNDKGLLPFLNTTVTCVHLDYNGMGEGGGRALAETLRLNTTRKSLNHRANYLFLLYVYEQWLSSG